MGIWVPSNSVSPESSCFQLLVISEKEGSFKMGLTNLTFLTKDGEVGLYLVGHLGDLLLLFFIIIFYYEPIALTH